MNIISFCGHVTDFTEFKEIKVVDIKVDGFFGLRKFGFNFFKDDDADEATGAVFEDHLFFEVRSEVDIVELRGRG